MLGVDTEASSCQGGGVRRGCHSMRRHRHAGSDIGNLVFNCSSVIDGVALWATHGRHEKLRVPPMVERLPELRSPSFHFWQQLTPHIHLWYNVRELLCSTCSHDSQLPTRWAGRSKSGLRSGRWPDGRCVTTRSTLPTTPHSHRNQHLKKGELKEYSQIEMFKTESLHYS